MKITDQLVKLASGVGNPAFDKTAGAELAFQTLSPEQAVNLYRSSWMARAIVDEPAHDMTRAWRSWQEDETAIELISDAERSLRLRGKVHNAVQLARLTGQAAIYVGTGSNAASPLTGNLAQGAMDYLHVFKGSELVGADPVTDLASANFGGFSHYDYDPGRIIGAHHGRSGHKIRIHSSRLIWFRGATEPDHLFGGQSVLQHCHQPIIDAEVILAHAQALVGEAKLDVIKVRDLASTLSTADGIESLQKRYTEGLALKSILGVTLIDSSSEEWDRKQVNFAYLPELIQQRLELVAAAARMPVTKLLGQSPGGMNATGESDLRNYYDMISGRQETGLRSALERLDQLLLAHAGVSVPAHNYVWNPLYQLDEVQAAEAALKRAQAAAL
ncbi:MAG: DUF1073 domain-containing protein [Hellea sp.]|nr:DUF1073 domain-containing protein [Hellea sp.]